MDLSMTPKEVRDLISFENNLVLVQDIRFRKTKTNFQKKLFNYSFN